MRDVGLAPPLIPHHIHAMLHDPERLADAPYHASLCLALADLAEEPGATKTSPGTSNDAAVSGNRPWPGARRWMGPASIWDLTRVEEPAGTEGESLSKPDWAGSDARTPVVDSFPLAPHGLGAPFTAGGYAQVPLPPGCGVQLPDLATLPDDVAGTGGRLPSTSESVPLRSSAGPSPPLFRPESCAESASVGWPAEGFLFRERSREFSQEQAESERRRAVSRAPAHGIDGADATARGTPGETSVRACGPSCGPLKETAVGVAAMGAGGLYALRALDEQVRESARRRRTAMSLRRRAEAAARKVAVEEVAPATDSSSGGKGVLGGGEEGGEGGRPSRYVYFFMLHVYL